MTYLLMTRISECDVCNKNVCAVKCLSHTAPLGSSPIQTAGSKLRELNAVALESLAKIDQMRHDQNYTSAKLNAHSSHF
jgi:hypothetical protein